MTRRQKHKSMKRPRSWHHRGRGPDWAFQNAIRRLDRAMKDQPNTEKENP